jgi:Tfp pilus assembly protein PilO
MRSKQFFFVTLALLLLSVASIIGAFTWGDGYLEAKSSEVAGLIAERDISREKILRLQNSKQSVDNLDEVTALLDRLLPQKKEQEKLIADVIFTATSEAEIPFSKVSSFSFSGGSEPSDLSGTVVSKGNPGVYEYPFTLRIVEIDYSTLLKLLQEIETNGRIVQVENIQISPTGVNSTIVSATISAKAYIRP